MSRIIVGLEQSGFQFMNDVIHYCQSTGHPTHRGFVESVYHECLSQIMAQIDVDFQTFMANIMMLPAWSAIHYLDEPVNYDIVGPFGDQVRAMAVLIWNRLKTKGNLNENYFYMLETCTETMMVVVCAVDSNDPEVN